MKRARKKTEYSAFIGIDKHIDAKKSAAKAYCLIPVTKKSVEAVIDDLNQQINELEKERIELLEEMLHDFSLLEDVTQYKVLKLHYIDGLTWDEMHNELGYSPRHLRRIRDAALKEIAEKKKLSSNAL